MKFRSTYLSEENGYALAINENNAIVGYLTGTEIRNRPHYWLAIPGRRSIDVLSVALSCGPYPEGRANDIKDDDPDNNYDGEWICGTLLGDAIDDQCAAVWLSPTEEPILLPVGEGTISTTATALNRQGIIVGTHVFDQDGVRQSEAVAWALIAKESGITPLGPISLETRDVPHDINSSGLAVGDYRVDGIAAVYATGWQIDLDLESETLTLVSLHGYSPNVSQLFGVNDAGYTCGWEYFDDAGWKALLLDPTVHKLPLKSIPNDGIKGNPHTPPPPGFPTVYEPYYASALNNLPIPQVVGSVFYTSALWQGDEVIDLSSVVGRNAPFVRDPEDINDDTWIVGTIGGSVPRPVVMFPE